MRHENEIHIGKTYLCDLTCVKFTQVKHTAIFVWETFTHGTCEMVLIIYKKIINRLNI